VSHIHRYLVSISIINGKAKTNILKLQMSGMTMAAIQLHHFYSGTPKISSNWFSLHRVSAYIIKSVTKLVTHLGLTGKCQNDIRQDNTAFSLNLPDHHEFSFRVAPTCVHLSLVCECACASVVVVVVVAVAWKVNNRYCVMMYVTRSGI
jgi:hypothetical protein